MNETVTHFHKCLLPRLDSGFRSTNQHEELLILLFEWDASQSKLTFWHCFQAWPKRPAIQPTCLPLSFAFHSNKNSGTFGAEANGTFVWNVYGKRRVENSRVRSSNGPNTAARQSRPQECLLFFSKYCKTCRAFFFFSSRRLANVFTFFE